MDKSFKEYMEESKSVNKWFAVKVAIGGAFCGALLAVAFAMVGLTF